ncbi:MAG: integrase catalytic domain-containing protein [Bacteroidales bacterium]|nr:integrase catalytic domain-containing protein [Bacteroidales bacterium]
MLALSNTECGSDVLYRAGLFSCLTGLRLSDIILLSWDNIKISTDGGWVLDITTKKTRTDAVLPISEEALELCGERGDGQVFKGLSPWIVNKFLKQWVKDAGITKHITFHSFRHTFATLQLAEGTDIYTLSKLLTHSNLSTTQVYTDVVSKLKREASTRISLKNNKEEHHS